MPAGRPPVHRFAQPSADGPHDGRRYAVPQHHPRRCHGSRRRSPWHSCGCGAAGNTADPDYPCLEPPMGMAALSFDNSTRGPATPQTPTALALEHGRPLDLQQQHHRALRSPCCRSGHFGASIQSHTFTRSLYASCVPITASRRTPRRPPSLLGTRYPLPSCPPAPAERRLSLIHHCAPHTTPCLTRCYSLAALLLRFLRRRGLRHATPACPPNRILPAPVRHHRVARSLLKLLQLQVS